MAKLKLGAIADDKPVKITIELLRTVHRDLRAYAEVLARETWTANPGSAETGRAHAVRFMATDRAFVKARRRNQTEGEG
jgi:hypothetical protein